MFSNYQFVYNAAGNPVCSFGIRYSIAKEAFEEKVCRIFSNARYVCKVCSIDETVLSIPGMNENEKIDLPTACKNLSFTFSYKKQKATLVHQCAFNSKMRVLKR